MHKILFLFLMVLSSSCSTTFYVVRHAEKEVAAPNMTSDVELSSEGKQRAQALKERLKWKVDFILSTRTRRTMQTAEPLSSAIKKAIHVYDHSDTTKLKEYKTSNENILFVGHSNTVDDIVNFFMDKKVLTDLPETSYGDLFIIKRKGKNFTFSQEHFGK